MLEQAEAMKEELKGREAQLIENRAAVEAKGERVQALEAILASREQELEAGRAGLDAEKRRVAREAQLVELAQGSLARHTVQLRSAIVLVRRFEHALALKAKMTAAEVSSSLTKLEIRPA